LKGSVVETIFLRASQVDEADRRYGLRTMSGSHMQASRPSGSRYQRQTIRLRVGR
jgi:hypothetical protein